MAQKPTKLPVNNGLQDGMGSAPNTAVRVAKYGISRAISIILALSVGIFLAVLITNFGGFVDMIYQDKINGVILGLAFVLKEEKPPLPTEEIHQILNQTEWEMQEAYGLHEPFLKRCLNWTAKAVVFDWGETVASARWYFGERGETYVKDIVLESLPNSLLLFGIANLLAFFMSVFVALILSRRLGSLLDKLVVALTPIYSAPSWVVGVILIAIFVAELKILPASGMRTQFHDYAPELTRTEEILDVAKHTILPVMAIFISVFFQGVYAWRSYFALNANEDYLEMAKAKGLSSRFIERRYLLRPSMPAIITSFAMMLITFWQGSLALEYLFDWPGIGRLFVISLNGIERGVIMSIVVLFAYLLGGTVFLLDILYALVDPRVKVGFDNPSVQLGKRRRSRLFELKKKKIDRSRLLGHVYRSGSKPSLKSRKKVSGRKIYFWQIKSFWKEFKRYPSAVIGSLIIIILICISIFTLVAFPYDDTVNMWRSVKLDYYKVPEMAQPVWVNWFREDKLPPTIVVSTWQDDSFKQVEVVGDKGMKSYDITYEFDYSYKYYPQDVYLFFDTNYVEKKAYVILTWITPDGREIELHKASMPSDKLMSLQWPIRDEWTTKFGGVGGEPLQVLFGGQGDTDPVPVHGTYQLHLEGFTFEEGADLNAELVMVGLVHGWGGTDNHGHDLLLSLLWGMPVALAFGLIGAIGTSLATMILAAVSAWFGGWVDGVIQRVTEVNIILPMLPFAMTINYLYGKTIWHILGIIVLLSIFGSGIKKYRTVFLQIKEDPYIEAAKAYGASNWRIIFHYLVPRVMPMLIPQLVILVPGYVFLEATLAFLGVSDRFIPTWGKLISQAIFALSAFEKGDVFMIFEPLLILLITGLSFTMLGLALERILNPRLQDS